MLPLDTYQARASGVYATGFFQRERAGKMVKTTDRRVARGREGRRETLEETNGKENEKAREARK